MDDNYRDYSNALYADRA